jgi:hypothetical protein
LKILFVWLIIYLFNEFFRPSGTIDSYYGNEKLLFVNNDELSTMSVEDSPTTMKHNPDMLKHGFFFNHSPFQVKAIKDPIFSQHIEQVQVNLY